MADGHRERLMAKALESGIESLHNHEMMELYLFSALPRCNTNELAHALEKKFKTFHAVCAASIEELTEIKGIGQAAAKQIKLFPQIARAYHTGLYGDKLKYSDTKNLGLFCVHLLSTRTNEAFYVLCFNSGGSLLKSALVAEGTPSQVFVEPRQVIEHIANTSTTSVIICHNHPGGSSIPSQNDIDTTQKIKFALEAIDIELRDHIIVASGNFISFTELKIRV